MRQGFPVAFFAVACALRSCVSCRVGSRFYDFGNRDSKVLRIAKYVLDILCPFMARVNFDVTRRVSCFRFFWSRDPNFNFRARRVP